VLLERSDQLAALAEALDAVLADGAGTLVFVGGEAGVGKTTLLQAFCDDRRGLGGGSCGEPARGC
jgi:predicted ATP-dependent serine protease